MGTRKAEFSGSFGDLEHPRAHILGITNPRLWYQETQNWQKLALKYGLPEDIALYEAVIMACANSDAKSSADVARQSFERAKKIPKLKCLGRPRRRSEEQNVKQSRSFFFCRVDIHIQFFLSRLYPPDPNSEGLNPRFEPFPKFYQLNQDSNVMACLYHVWSALVVTTLPGFAWTPSTPWSMLWDVMKVWSRQNAPLPRSLKKGYDQIEWPLLWCLEEISPANLKEGGIPIVSYCTERFLNSKLFKTGQWIYTVIWVCIYILHLAAHVRSLHISVGQSRRTRVQFMFHPPCQMNQNHEIVA